MDLAPLLGPSSCGRPVLGDVDACDGCAQTFPVPGVTSTQLPRSTSAFFLQPTISASKHTAAMAFMYAAPAFGPALPAMAAPPKGLALVLEMARDSAGLSLAAATAMAAVTSSPLLAHSLRGKGASMAKLAAAAAVPAITYSMQPQCFSAKADSPPETRTAAAADALMEEVGAMGVSGSPGVCRCQHAMQDDD